MKVLIFGLVFCSLIFAELNTPLKCQEGCTIRTVIVLNDMYIEVDTVQNVVDWRQSGKMWYLKTKTGEAWSDVIPVKIKE